MNIQDKTICKICNQKYSSVIGVSKHLWNKHKIKTKDYYDRYFKKKNDDICQVCHTNSTTFSNLDIGYLKYCSNKCLANSSEVDVKKRKTMMDRYGVESPLQDQEIHRRKEKTCKDRFGFIYVANNPNILKRQIESRIKHFGYNGPFEKKENRDKVLKLIKLKYRAKNWFDYPEVKLKYKNTCLQRYGCSHPSQRQELKDIKKQTSLKKYGFDHFSKSPRGRELHRINGIKQVEIQKLSGEPLMPCIGKNERLCLDELQTHTSFGIIRNDNSFRYIIGRFPDGHIPELKIFIQFDEKNHFIDKLECKKYSQNDIDCTLQLASLGYIVFRISEYIWLENREKVIEQFLTLANNIKYEV